MILKALLEFLRNTPRLIVRDGARNKINNSLDFGYYKKIYDYNRNVIIDVIREPYSRIETIVKIN